MTTHGSATNLQAVYPSSGLNARADDQSTPGLTRSGRSEEHTSELQSQSNLVCRLLLEKKKKHIMVVFVLPTDQPVPNAFVRYRVYISGRANTGGGNAAIVRSSSMEIFIILSAPTAVR